MHVEANIGIWRLPQSLSVLHMDYTCLSFSILHIEAGSRLGYSLEVLIMFVSSAS